MRRLLSNLCRSAISAIQVSLAFLAIVLGSTSFAFAIDSRLVIQPIAVSGSNGGQVLFEEQLDKMYAQAGIDVAFLPFAAYSNPAYRFLSFVELNDLFGVAPSASSDPTVVNMWFVDEIEFDIAGYTNGVGSNEIVISSSSLLSNDDFGILSHEIGHALGLNHADDPYGWETGKVSSLPKNLMSISPSTWYTSSLDDIAPDGAGYFSLSDGQVATIRSSPYIRAIAPIPEPEIYAMLGVGLGFMGWAARRRKQQVT